MVSKETVLDVLATINDPEMPISIVDLGIIEDVRIQPGMATDAEVIIDLLPTFIGCPALSAIEQAVRQRVHALAGVGRVEVHFRFDPPWTVDRISPAGREALRQIGVTVPAGTEASPAQCPYCGSSSVHRESPFGPTRCRMIYYCDSCKNSFEHMKKAVGSAKTTDHTDGTDKEDGMV